MKSPLFSIFHEKEKMSTMTKCFVIYFSVLVSSEIFHLYTSLSLTLRLLDEKFFQFDVLNYGNFF